MFSLGFQVCLVRFLWSVKATFAKSFSVVHDLHQPFSLVGAHPKKTRRVGFCWFPYVLQIFGSSDRSKILKTIVLFVAIFVVNMIFGKLSGHVQPSKPVRQHFFVVDGNRPIPRVSWASSNFSDKIRTAFVGHPLKNSAFWIVGKNGFDMVRCNHDSEFTIRLA